MSASPPRCSICKEPVKPPSENSWFPFCSNRCKVLDLSRWLNGDYRIPTTDDEPDTSPVGEDDRLLH